MEIEQGYEDERFESDVPHNFHCAICLSVLKQPMQCVRNEHSFCRPCITRYLENAERCPSCIEPLTLEILRPSRVIADLMSQLKIKCDNVAKGCPDVVKLETLEDHVASCGFSVVKCSNIGCETTINRRDQQRHENFECDYRQVKCEVCGENVAYARQKLHCYVTKEELKKMREEMREEMREIRASVKEMMVVCRDLTSRIDDVNLAINNGNAQMGHVKRTISKNEKKVESSRQASQSSVPFPALPAAGSLRNVNFRNDVIIAGGGGLSSVEIFSWTTRQWTPLPSMMTSRWRSSSFVYQNQMFVCGGRGRDSVEVLELKDGKAEWKNFPGRLPHSIWAHASVVHEDNLFIFGGSNYLETVVSNISKVSLVSPFSSQIVSHMPGPRCVHGAQLFGETIVVVGGTTTGFSEDCLASVLEYDIIKNCCRTLAPLPYAVCRMATVSWQDNIIIIGGEDKNDNVLNSVLCYNVKEQKCNMLPSMKYKRSGCTAVVTGNVIIVMGGWNEGGLLNSVVNSIVMGGGNVRQNLNSVECFDFCNYVWTELSPMNKNRSCATAVATSN